MKIHSSGRRLLATFLIAVASVVAQGPPKPLPPVFAHGGDAMLHVTFRSTSHRLRRDHDVTGETIRTVQDHEWQVSGLLEVKTSNLGDGLLVFSVVGVVGALEGHATESQAWVREKIAGEGGLMELREWASEGWSATGLQFDHLPAAGTLEVDLDRRTWTAPELGDAFDGWPQLLQAHESYQGEWHPDPDSDQAALFSFDKQVRLTGLLGDSPERPSKRSAQELGLQQKLARANALSTMVKAKGAADALAGSAEIELVAGEDRVTAKVSWALRRELPELELRVDGPGFARWRPTADRLPLIAERLPGPALAVTAELVDATGAPVVGVRIRRLRWWLEDTSRLPGVCSNWPYASTDTSPDLEFDSARATDERQRLEFVDLTTLRKTVRVVPFDFGGWSTLRVEAELDDGRVVRGRRKGQSGDETAIRLPDREPDSKIANEWKRLLAIGNKADDADDEETPVGNGKGDGLTLFEEYRGFYVDGVYDFGDPEGKDVFVYDEVGSADTRAAIGRFAAAVEVGSFLHRMHPGHGEMDASRVINRNRGDGPTRGAQHVIRLRPAPAGGYGGVTGDRPGRGFVLVPAQANVYSQATRLRQRRDLYVRGIAQAMLMVCGVRQPGSLDPGTMRFTARRTADGVVVVTDADGKEVAMRDESGRVDLGEQWLRTAERDAAVLRRKLRGAAGAEATIASALLAAASRTLYVARRGGQHSGPLANILRDTFADAYRVPEARTVHVLAPGADMGVGWQLPATSTGDGFNGADHYPRPRFGDSPRPAARSQFCVNDHVR